MRVLGFRFGKPDVFEFGSQRPWGTFAPNDCVRCGDCRAGVDTDGPVRTKQGVVLVGRCNCSPERGWIPWWSM